MATRDARWAYEVLGLPFGASPSEVRQAHRDLIAVWHPDRFTANPRLIDRANKKTQEFNAAFALIRDFKPSSLSVTSTQAPPSAPPSSRPEGGSEQGKTTQSGPPSSPSQETRYRPSWSELVETGRGRRMVFYFIISGFFMWALVAEIILRNANLEECLIVIVLGIVWPGVAGWRTLQTFQRWQRGEWDRN